MKLFDEDQILYGIKNFEFDSNQGVINELMKSKYRK